MASLNFPSNPTDKQLYNAPNNATYIYNATRGIWSTLKRGEAASTTANPGATPPLNPVYGALWMDTDSNFLYVYVNTNGGEWQKVSGSGGSGTNTSTSVPGLALEGSAVYDDNIQLTDVGIFLETLPES